ncbi:hypothetical protein WN943_006929 [Citrus x changshan-huyou]
MALPTPHTPPAGVFFSKVSGVLLYKCCQCFLCFPFMCFLAYLKRVTSVSFHRLLALIHR